jgi:hypothetical protein
MARRDAVELMDQPWLPGLLRDGITGALRASEELFHPYEALLPRLAAMLATTDSRRLVDLCSGAGGPSPSLFRRLRELGRADERVMTDRFPHAAAARHAARQPGVRYVPYSVDATAVDPALTGVRTLFNALHHLPPAVAKGVLRDAALARQPLLVVETLSRSPAGALGALNVALSCYATLPVPGPGWAARVVLTWPVPILPVVMLWEGVASCWRCYDDVELTALLPAVDGYRFSVERVQVPHLPFLWLTVVEGRVEA